jgi:hypothetical protein
MSSIIVLSDGITPKTCYDRNAQLYVPTGIRRTLDIQTPFSARHTPSFRTKSTYLKYILYKNARCKDVQQFCSFDIFRSVSRNTKWASIYFNASPNMSINYEQILIRGNTSMTAPCLDPHLEIDCRVG